jgi:hypothetical protein
MIGWRLWSLVGGGVALVASALWLMGLLRERDRLRVAVDLSRACTRAVESGADLSVCPQPVADAAERARRYLQCDAALAEGRGYGIAAACSEAVKRRDAQASASAHEAVQLEAELTRTRAQARAALTRAESRAQSNLRSAQNAAAALARAPMGADGRLRCDDQCLRELVGD